MSSVSRQMQEKGVPCRTIWALIDFSSNEIFCPELCLFNLKCSLLPEQCERMEKEPEGRLKFFLVLT